MRDEPITKAEQFQLKNQKQRYRRRGLVAMATAVAFMTTYLLMLPATTMEQPICGLEDHGHGEACYTQVLSCEQEAYVPAEGEALHIHGELCYGERQLLTCLQQETAGHMHTDECIGYTCGLNETPGHVHTEDCSGPALVLTCTQPEAEPHTHGNDCYVTAVTLSCSEEEGELHTHEGGCYTEETTLVCDLPLIDSHAHGEDCYEEETMLLCGQTEELPHTHEEVCMGLLCGREELPAHTHGDLCYITETYLICSEPTEAHTHEETCYVRVLDCGQTEHTHSKACYDTAEPEIFCGQEEHTHSETCYDAEGLLICQQTEHIHEETCVKTPEKTNVLEETMCVLLDAMAEHIFAAPAVPEALTAEEYQTLCMDDELNAAFAAYYEALAAFRETHPDATEEYFMETLYASEIYSPALEKLMAMAAVLAGDVKLLDLSSNKADKPNDTAVVDTVTEAESNIDFKLFNYNLHINDYPLSGGTDGTPPDHDSRYFFFRGNNHVDGNVNDNGTLIWEYKSTVVAGDATKNTLYSGTKQTGDGIRLRGTDQDGYTIWSHATLDPILDADGYPDFYGRDQENAIGDADDDLDYLFGGADPYDAVRAYDPDNTPLQYDAETKTYTYSSQENAVDFRIDREQRDNTGAESYGTGEFLVRDYTERGTSAASYQTYGSYYDFLPFTYRVDDPAAKEYTYTRTDKTTATTSYDFEVSEVDYWQGMTMEFDFYMPKNGQVFNERTNRLEDMVFSFSGDDDVWVFIDNVLVLDMGGTHGPVTGYINFADGTVESYLDFQNAGPDNVAVEGTASEYTGTATGQRSLWETFHTDLVSACNGGSAPVPNGGWTDAADNAAKTFNDYTQHSLKFFYLERGAAVANCAMSFNMPTVPKNSLRIEKELSAAGTVTGSPDYTFQVLKADENGVLLPMESVFPTGTRFSVYRGDTNTGTTGTVDDAGCFTLKAGQAAVFPEAISADLGCNYVVRELFSAAQSEQYMGVDYRVTTVARDGTYTSDTTAAIGSVSDGMQHYDTAPVSPEETSVTIRAVNKVEEAPRGSLSVTKLLEDGNAAASEEPALLGLTFDDGPRSFDFEVTLGGSPVPEETPYVLTAPDGTTVNQTVTVPGIISLAAGETATLSDMLAGTAYTVRETADSAAGYLPAYTGGDETLPGGGVGGTVELGEAVAVTVTNTEGGAQVEIPLRKTLENGDGIQRTYAFALVQVTDETGTETVPGGTELTAQLELTDTAAETTFVLAYLATDINQTSTFWYKVTETAGTDPYTDYDETAYVVEVTVGRLPGRGGLQGEISAIYQDGVAVPETSEQTRLDFTNALRSGIRLTKQAERTDGIAVPADREFRFVITLPADCAGSYPAVYSNSEENGATHTATVLTFAEEGGGTCSAQLALYPDESILIGCLPPGKTAEITETDTDGYSVTWCINGVEASCAASAHVSINTVAGEETAVVCTNTTGAVLPSTGGSGTEKLLLLGTMLSLSAGCVMAWPWRKNLLDDGLIEYTE